MLSWLQGGGCDDYGRGHDYQDLEHPRYGPWWSEGPNSVSRGGEDSFFDVQPYHSIPSWIPLTHNETLKPQQYDRVSCKRDTG